VGGGVKFGSFVHFFICVEAEAAELFAGAHFFAFGAIR
jgi:hypothetical protein